MSLADDVVQRYYERYPEPGPDDTPTRYRQEMAYLRNLMRLLDKSMRERGIDEDTRAFVVRDLLYGTAGGHPEAQRRSADGQPRVAVERWRPPGEGSGWTHELPAVTPRDRR